MSRGVKSKTHNVAASGTREKDEKEEKIDNGHRPGSRDEVKNNIRKGQEVGMEMGFCWIAEQFRERTVYLLRVERFNCKH